MTANNVPEGQMSLIFLAGASGSTVFWEPVKRRLPENWVKTIFHYPSFGGYMDDPNIQSFADLQAHVIGQIQCPSVLIAQSMGGIFAVQAALQKPKFIQALILVVTSGGINLSNFEVADWRKDYQQTFTVPNWFVENDDFLDDRLSEIQCPVLLIWGDDDPISPLSVGRYLESQFKQARLEIIEGGQHDLAFKFSEQVADVIDDFIKSIK